MAVYTFECSPTDIHRNVLSFTSFDVKCDVDEPQSHNKSTQKQMRNQSHFLFEMLLLLPLLSACIYIFVKIKMADRFKNEKNNDNSGVNIMASNA